MTWVRAVAALAACLATQLLLGRLAPSALGFLDLLLLPMAWYGLRGAQRSAMLAGCAGGLLQDAWLEPGLFGVSGFAKTLLGWGLGGLGARFDLNALWARAAAGAVLPAADLAVKFGLRRLFDQASAPITPVDLIVRGLATGLLLPFLFAILDRTRPGRPGGTHARRRA